MRRSWVFRKSKLREKRRKGVGNFSSKNDRSSGSTRQMGVKKCMP